MSNFEQHIRFSPERFSGNRAMRREAVAGFESGPLPAARRMGQLRMRQRLQSVAALDMPQPHQERPRARNPIGNAVVSFA